MKLPDSLTAKLSAALIAGFLASTGAAYAQSGGGGSSSEGPGQGSGGEANGVYPAPTQGVEQGAAITDNTSGTHGTTHKRWHHKHHTKKPADDANTATPNAPGTNPGSDTPGQ